MATKQGIICLVAIVFLYDSQSSGAEAKSTLESEVTCISKWQKLKIKWNIDINTLEISNQTFVKFWSENEEHIKNQTVERLKHVVIYPRNFTEVMSCSGTLTKYTGLDLTWRNNVSFYVRLPKIGSELLGVRFKVIRGENNHRSQFYIRPSNTTNDVSYRINYCKVRSNDIPLLRIQRNFTCPRYKSAEFSCSYHKDGVYEIPGSAGFICEATTDVYVNFFSTFVFYIESKTKQSHLRSADFRVFSKQSRDKHVSRHAKQGLFTAVLIGLTPRNLRTTIIEQQKVKFEWSSVTTHQGIYAFYKVNYSCTNGVTPEKPKIIKVTSTKIHNGNFTPYSLCTFCVQSQENAGNLYSEPACKSLRFPEQPPNKAPNITCNYNSCPTTTNDDSRAVTVQCEFPAKDNWNGILNRLVIKYWFNNSTLGEVQVFETTNLTLCQITLKGLSTKYSYAAQLSVCNSKGCSPSSDTVFVAKSIPLPDHSNTSKLLWLTLLLLIPIIIGIYLALVKLHRCLEKRKEENRLPNVADPNEQYEDLRDNPARSPEEYHELPNDKQERLNNN